MTEETGRPGSEATQDPEAQQRARQVAIDTDPELNRLAQIIGRTQGDKAMADRLRGELEKKLKAKGL